MLFLLWTFIDIVGRSDKMLAKFEKRAYAGSERVWVGKYRNLHNIAHWHMEHELIACAEGSAKVMLDDTTYRLAPNQCVFCQSGSVHSIEADPDSLLYVCLFDENICASVTQVYQPVTPLFLDRYGVLQTLSDLRHELSDRQLFFETKADAMITELVISVFRGEPLTAAVHQTSEVTTRYKQLLNRMDAEYDSLTFQNAAAFMNVSEAYFSRYFKQQSGMTFSQYLNVVRVEKAVQLINAHPERKLTDIMLCCGFNTIRNFNRAFKEITGYSPRGIPAGYVLNTRSVPTVQDTVDPTSSEAELVTE